MATQARFICGGASGEVYDLDNIELEALYRRRDVLLVHFGSLKNAVIAIASLQELEDAPPLVVLALLHAAKEMKS